MENILVVLAIIGSVIYKIYTSYKEEMDKAAKRKPQAHVPPPVPNVKPTVQEIRRPMPPPAPTVPTSTLPKKQKVEKKQPVIVYEETVPVEVKNVQRYKTEKLHKQLKTEKEEHVHEPFHFDLKQAIIQSAILDRPYQ